MKLRSLTISLAVLALFVSCTAGTEGIFASIEREEKIKSEGGLETYATVTHMAELGGRYYVAGGGALFEKSVGQTKWSASSVKKGYQHTVSVGLAGTTLWAVANKDATSSSALFSSTDGSNWQEVTVPNGALPYSLVPIRQTNGITSSELILTTRSSNGFRYLYRIGAGGLSAVVDMGTWTDSITGTILSYGTPVTAAAYDSVSASYFVINDSALINLSTPLTMTTGMPASSGYTGLILLADAATSMDDLNTGTSDVNAYLSTKNGDLYWGTLSATAWSAVGAKTGVEDDSSDDVTFGQFLYQITAGSEALWIGTMNGVTNEGAGYASLATNHSFDILPPEGTDSNNYNSSDLTTAPVPLLFRASNGDYFLGTVAHGLWVWDASAKTWGQQ